MFGEQSTLDESHFTFLIQNELRTILYNSSIQCQYCCHVSNMFLQINERVQHGFNFLPKPFLLHCDPMIALAKNVTILLKPSVNHVAHSCGSCGSWCNEYFLNFCIKRKKSINIYLQFVYTQPPPSQAPPPQKKHPPIKGFIALCQSCQPIGFKNKSTYKKYWPAKLYFCQGAYKNPSQF